MTAQQLPPHPGLALKRELDARAVSIVKAARYLDVSRSTLDDVLKGRSRLTPIMALRFELADLGPAGLWLDWQVAHTIAKTRLKLGLLRLRSMRPTNLQPDTIKQ